MAKNMAKTLAQVRNSHIATIYMFQNKFDSQAFRMIISKPNDIEIVISIPPG